MLEDWDVAVEVTDQEAQSVEPRSKRPRFAMCWQGRQEMRAVMAVGEQDERGGDGGGVGFPVDLALPFVRGLEEDVLVVVVMLDFFPG